MENSIETIVAGKYLHVKATGKLTKESYETFAPLVDAQIQQSGKLRILFETHEFHGWTAGALWEDLKFDAKHWKDIERLAIVGESKLEEGMAVFCKPFTGAKIQYFDHSDIAAAMTWIESD